MPAAIANAIRAALSPPGVQLLEPRALVDAALILELAGETLRPRLVFASAPDGRDLCLRPDLTVPTAISILERESEDGVSAKPAAYLCDGLVFRAARPGEARIPEFRQIGLERYDDDDSLEADTDVLTRALEAVASAGVRGATLRLGDAGLIPAMIDALSVPEPWRARLLSAAHSPALLKRRIAEAACPQATTSPLSLALHGLEPDAAEAAITNILALAEAPLVGGRSAASIAARMRDQAERAAAAPLSGELAQALLGTLAIADEPSIAFERLQAIAASFGGNLDELAAQWGKRLSALAGKLPEARFEGSYTGSFDYYDGLLFEIDHPACTHQPLAAGGRYDSLMAKLSKGERSAKAVGCEVRPDRVAQALKAKTSGVSA
jgi:ATP phosphoribosyltransferase regulatory subunit